MLSAKASSQRALFQASRQVRRSISRRHYATDYEQRTKETLKMSSRLTWLTTTAAAGAAALYYSTSSSSSSPEAASSQTSSGAASLSPSSPSSSSDSKSSSDASASKPGHRHEAEYASDVPKPVEDRHGDTVTKHSIAARKNQTKVRTGKFSGEEFDNHELKHTPGDPEGDFEKRK